MSLETPVVTSSVTGSGEGHTTGHQVSLSATRIRLPAAKR